MSNYATPGVYTEEIPLLPSSVAAISTAIPAFIGHTEKAIRNGKSIANQAVRIATLLEYQELFGAADSISFSLDIGEGQTVSNVSYSTPRSTLYNALDLYFKNGGGDCYIISVGSYDEALSKDSFSKGLEILKKEDEPTLIMLGEAVHLDSYHEICQEALAQCADLKDRFCILDIPNNEGAADAFRSSIGTDYLKYGAAYTPYLQTALNYAYSDSDVTITDSSASGAMEYRIEGVISITYMGSIAAPKVKINKGTTGVPVFSIADGVLTIGEVGDGIIVEEFMKAWDAFTGDKSGFDIQSLDDTGLVVSFSGTKDMIAKRSSVYALASIKGTALYSKVVSELAKEKLILPPSTAIAGVYAKTDREIGVWKAPANVSLNSVLGPVVKISSADQERLNVDVESGKSINAIRSFAGKGTMVWGARTLAGNDNEWRYVSVRRLFNMIEESVSKATQFAVFESNDAVTWLKVKAMVQSFLYGIWQQGGLAGATEEQAYFVNIGLGKTMTQQDVLEGKMIIEIGLAATRPAEFIILKFSHKLQEA